MRRPGSSLVFFMCTIALLVAPRSAAAGAPSARRPSTSSSSRPRATTPIQRSKSPSNATKKQVRVLAYSQKAAMRPMPSRTSVTVKFPNISTVGVKPPKQPDAHGRESILRGLKGWWQKRNSSLLRVLKQMNHLAVSKVSQAEAIDRVKRNEPPLRVARERGHSVGAYDQEFNRFRMNFEDVQMVSLKPGTKLYRCWGGTFCGQQSAKNGRWLTDSELNAALHAQRELALPGSPPIHITEFTVREPGAIAYRGGVAPAFGQPGGGTQTFIPFISKNSLQEGMTVDLARK
ncbi:MAG: hypothetical protein JXP34_13880 [Planctomycetes bacterium]|nr:hypothetical protein [Planctomycetota bacterium]